MRALVAYDNPLRKEVAEAIQRLQPALDIVAEQPGVLQVAGTFVLKHDAEVFDTYGVSIHVFDGFPEDEPHVYETSGRIPRKEHRHINERNGSACVGVWEEWLARSSDVSFGAYLSGPVWDFFTSQTIFEATGKWPWGERQHGLPGVVEAYADVLGIEPRQEMVLRYLHILDAMRIEGHRACPCGSGANVWRCHREQLNDLRARIPRRLIRKMLARIRNPGIGKC